VWPRLFKTTNPWPDLLPELESKFRASRDKPPEESHADTYRDVSVELGTPMEKVEAGLAELEAQPAVIRGLLVHRIAEALLEGHRRACRADRG